MNNLSYKTQKNIIVVLFLFLPVLLLATFSYYPAINLIHLSFTSWDGISPVKNYVGLENYCNILSDASLYTPFLHNLIYLMVGFVQIGMALYFAVILNTKLKGKDFYKTLLFLPYIINSVAIVFIFNYFFNNEHGALNITLKSIGLNGLALNWLGDPNIVNFTMAFMSLWKYMGFTMVIFLGALQSVPAEIYEAANIDGASQIQSFWSITLPSIKSIVGLVLFLNLNGAIGSFEFPFIIYPMTSPFDMSETFMTKTIHTAFSYSNYGLASAMGVVLILITSVLVILQNKIISRGD